MLSLKNLGSCSEGGAAQAEGAALSEERRDYRASCVFAMVREDGGNGCQGPCRRPRKADSNFSGAVRCLIVTAGLPISFSGG